MKPDIVPIATRPLAAGVGKADRRRADGARTSWESLRGRAWSGTFSPGGAKAARDARGTAMGDGPDGLRYTAFLSYSHRDAAAAGRLHRRLETYRMPKRLVGTESARGPVPARLAPIFRDREELPAATDLSETVRAALAQSGALIVLCSPAAATSLWVAEEIETFRRIHPDRPVLAAILDGDPPDCFPQVLRAFGQDGTWHEPLATDLRRHRDGQRLGLLKLVAGITGVGLDALVQRDAARRIRRVMAVTAMALIAMLGMAALALVAVDARGEAERQRAEAQRQRAEAEGQIEFMLTELREELMGVGRLSIRTLVNRRALQYYARQGALSQLSAESLARRARVLQAIGEDYRAGGNLAAALAAFRQAHRTTAEQLSRAPDDPERIFAHSQSEFWIGRVPYDQHNYPAARSAWVRYKALADRLAARDPHNMNWVREAAFAQGNLCTVDLKAPIDGRATLRSCMASLARMQQAYRLRAEPAIAVAVANRYAWVADAHLALGENAQALANRMAQQRLVMPLLAADPENVDYKDVWVGLQLGLAILDRLGGRRLQGRDRLVAARRVLDVMIAGDRTNRDWQVYRAMIVRELAN